SANQHVRHIGAPGLRYRIEENAGSSDSAHNCTATAVRKMYFVPASTVAPACFNPCSNINADPAFGCTSKLRSGKIVFPPSKSWLRYTTSVSVDITPLIGLGAS